MAQDNATRNTLRTIDTGLIDPGNNDRKEFDAEELAQLASSIDSNGLAQPPTVRPKPDGRYELVAGERRFRACSENLGWATIPAFVRDLDDAQAGAIMLAENVARVDLDPVEEANAYRARMATGLTVAEVAAQAGVQASRVQWRLDLLRLIPEALALVQSKQLGVGAAWELRDLDVNRQMLALRALSAGDLTATEFTKLCRQLQFEQDQDSMFDTDSFLQVDEYVADAKRRGLGKAGMVALIGKLTDALDAHTGAEGPDADLVAEARAALEQLQ